MRPLLPPPVPATVSTIPPRPGSRVPLPGAVPCRPRRRRRRAATALAALVLVAGGCGPPRAGTDRAGDASVRPALAGLDDGAMVDPFASDPGTLRTLVFVLPDCPIANATMPELRRLRAAFAPRGAELMVVYETASGAREAAREHARAYEVAAFAAHDPDGAVARAVGATISPQAVVLRFDGAGGWSRVYRGRIDDLWRAPGQRRAEARTHDLADALEAALAGRPAPVPETEAVGCFLPSSH